jgi:hypothetical protein
MVLEGGFYRRLPLLHQTHFGTKGGEPTFAAAATKVCSKERSYSQHGLTEPVFLTNCNLYKVNNIEIANTIHPYLLRRRKTGCARRLGAA